MAIQCVKVGDVERKVKQPGNQDILLKQGCLNKKEIQVNLCNIFPILLFNEFYFFA